MDFSRRRSTPSHPLTLSACLSLGPLYFSRRALVLQRLFAINDRGAGNDTDHRLKKVKHANTSCKKPDAIRAPGNPAGRRSAERGSCGLGVLLLLDLRKSFVNVRVHFPDLVLTQQWNRFAPRADRLFRQSDPRGERRFGAKQGDK